MKRHPELASVSAIRRRCRNKFGMTGQNEIRYFCEIWCFGDLVAIPGKKKREIVNLEYLNLEPIYVPDTLNPHLIIPENLHYRCIVFHQIT